MPDPLAAPAAALAAASHIEHRRVAPSSSAKRLQRSASLRYKLDYDERYETQ